MDPSWVASMVSSAGQIFRLNISGRFGGWEVNAFDQLFQLLWKVRRWGKIRWDSGWIHGTKETKKQNDFLGA